MHIFSSNSALKQYLTNECTKWEISDTWNIDNSTEHVLSLCVWAHQGLALHLQQPRMQLPRICSPRRKGVQCPGWGSLVQPWAARQAASSSCTAALRGCGAPVSSSRSDFSTMGSQHPGNVTLYNQPRGLEDHLLLSSVEVYPAAMLGITGQWAFFPFRS